MGDVVNLAHERVKRDLGEIFGERTYICALAGVGAASVEGRPMIFIGARSGEEHMALAFSLEDAAEMHAAVGAVLAGFAAVAQEDAPPTNPAPAPTEEEWPAPPP